MKWLNILSILNIFLAKEIYINPLSVMTYYIICGTKWDED